MDTCKKFSCDREDIMDCTKRHIKARTYFIKQCREQDVPITSIAHLLGDRTVSCIQSYLDGHNGELHYKSERTNRNISLNSREIVSNSKRLKTNAIA